MVFCLTVVTACKKSTDSIITPPTGRNLITNSSFESESGPTIDGWTAHDSTTYVFVQDAPVGGGRYSIVLQPLWRGGLSWNSVIGRVALPLGNQRYRMSCWAKRTTERAGSINLFFGSGDVDTMTAVVSIPVMDTVWKSYSTELTWFNQTTDSAFVVLYGGWSNISYLIDSTFFDLCQLEQID